MKIKLYQIIIVLFALFTVTYFFIKMLVYETKEDVYKILAETEYLMIDGDWKENIDTRYDYDEDGDRSSMTVLKFSNGNWVNDYKVIYLYDETKTIIGELYKTWKNNQWTDSLKIENFNKNSETGYISYDLRTGKLMPLEKLSIKLDTINKRKEEIKYIYENFDWKLIELTTTILNIELNPLEKTVKKLIDNALQYTNMSKYQYNELGLETSEEIYQWKDSNWVKFERFLNKYDTSNVQLTRLWQKWNSKDWVNGWICYYDYDDRLNLTTLVYNIWRDNSWFPDERYRYTYNNEDIGTAHYIDKWKETKWVDSLKNIYTFGKFTIKKKNK
ncbi:MAG: hypothetical protein N2319_10475 [Candidatus Kapabacteria bacterium]|nr:hypothetical protein [Candidatus Kapabacteria bacterium]